jgi:hypothetical protein
MAGCICNTRLQAIALQKHPFGDPGNQHLENFERYILTGDSTTKTSIWTVEHNYIYLMHKYAPRIYSKTKQLHYIHYIKIHRKSEKGNLTMPKSGIFFISSIETILPIWALYASADFF